MMRLCLTVVMCSVVAAACTGSDDAWNDRSITVITADDLAATPQGSMLELDLDRALGYIIDYSTPMDFDRVLLVARDQRMPLDHWLEEYRRLGFDYRDSPTRQFAVFGKAARSPLAESCHDECGGDPLIDIDDLIVIDNDIDIDIDNIFESEGDSSSHSYAASCAAVLGCIHIF